MNIRSSRASEYTNLGDSGVLGKRSLDESSLEDNNFKKNRNENAIAMGATESGPSSSNHLLERNSFSTSPPKLPTYTSPKVISSSAAGSNNTSSFLNINDTTISVKTAPPKKVSFADPLVTESFSVLRKESPKQKWDEAYQAISEAAQEFPARLKIFLADKEHPDLEYWKPAMKKTFEKSKALFELYQKEPTLKKRAYLLDLAQFCSFILDKIKLIFCKKVFLTISSCKYFVRECSISLKEIDVLLKKKLSVTEQIDTEELQNFTKNYNNVMSINFFLEARIYRREIEELEKEISQQLTETNLKEIETEIQKKELASKEASRKGHEFSRNALNISLPSNKLKFLAKEIEKVTLLSLQNMYSDQETLNILNEFFS